MKHDAYDAIVEALENRGYTPGVTLPFVRRGYNGPYHHFYNNPKGDPSAIITVWPIAMCDGEDTVVEVFVLTPVGPSITEALAKIATF